MHKRHEIDGLRALAVIPVILFHAGFSVFSGGFIGVDVFFVLSGYLITRMILEDKLAGNFSLRHFYARRARRILPALFFVMLVSVPFAWGWLLPSQYEDFSRSVLAVLLFVSNIFFWRESGYFAAEASEKPLLHTWSLGVEEQFYLLFPLALLLIWRLGRQHAFYAVVAAAIGSFALCQYAALYSPSANFFLLPTRAWELLVGAICAFRQVERPVAKHNVLGLMGLGCILIAEIFYNEYMMLPSAYTLLPVLGTALVLLYATAGTWAARVLSARVLVAIGLVSYSAYLWHHPLFAFARVRILTTPSPSIMLALTALSLLLGAITWWLVEQPFRNAQHRFYVGNRRALWVGCVAAVLLAAGGLHGYQTHGRLEHWMAHARTDQVRAYQLIADAAAESRYYDDGRCIFNITAITAKARDRMIGCQQKYGPGVAIIGDSHAINAFWVLKSRAGKRPFIIGISQGMCRPHADKPSCYYSDLVRLLKQYPQLFRDIVYEQAGMHLLRGAHGVKVERGDISGLPLDAVLPDFTPSTRDIDMVTAYLTRLAQFSRITWFGPRIEPHIRSSVIVQLGCAYRFDLRPNQHEVFARLDHEIQSRVAQSPIHYRSQIDMKKFNMASHFMTCDALYFTDGDHYSHAGEKLFGDYVTLDAVLGEKHR